MLSNPGAPRRRPTLKGCFPVRIIGGLPFLQPKLEQFSWRFDPRWSAMRRHQILLSCRRPNGLWPPFVHAATPHAGQRSDLHQVAPGRLSAFEEVSMSPNFLQQRMGL
jgi:hypothetical protein